MPDALIGYTGFVGGTLLRQRPFDFLYNSKNIDDIAGRAFDLVVCAAAPAEKWKANKYPEDDLKNIKRLMSNLERVEVGECILISTVDVYPAPIAVDEQTVIHMDECHPYGKHRYMLEQMISARFRSTIIRLPGLFGSGLKKNIIYDLIHANNVGQVHADSVFQFYDLRNLWSDVAKARQHGLKVVNFATEPVSVRALARLAFGIEFKNTPDGNPAQYDFRSLYAPIFGGHGGYLYDQSQVLSSLKRFVEAQPMGHQ